MRRKSLFSAAPRQIGNGAGHLDAGGSAADDDGRQEERLLGRILAHLGALVAGKQPGANAQRILDRLHRRRLDRPFVVAEVAVGRAGGEHEAVVSETVARSEQDAFPRMIDAIDLIANNAGRAMALEKLANRLGDVGRRQRRSRHLIEQRHEQIVVVAIDDSHPDRLAADRPRAGKAAEARADNHHMGRLPGLVAVGQNSSS